MIDEYLQLMRKWIRAEIEYGVMSHEIDSEGYYEGAYKEKNEADKVFIQFCEIIKTYLK